MSISLDELRDLTHATDSVKVGDGTDFLAIAADGSIAVTDNGGSLTVDSADLSTIAGDTTSIDGKTPALGQAVMAASVPVAIASDQSVISIDDNGGSLTVDGTVTVTATQLDIDDLDHATDSVAIGDGTDLLAIAADGSIAVTDNGTTLSIDDGGGSITVDGTVATTAGGLPVWKVTAATIDTTAGGTELVATPLANRVRMVIQNLGANGLYIKDATGVTTANGLKIPKKSSQEVDLNATANIFAIADASDTDIRVAEYATS